MGALAKSEVGEYVNDHFVCAYQKVGTFQVANGQKNGGNVASYFCLADGRVVHAIAGPVNAKTFVKEARWAVSTRELAKLEAKNDGARYKQVFAAAHRERAGGTNKAVARKNGSAVLVDDLLDTPAADPLDFAALAVEGNNGLANESKVHLILAKYPLVQLNDVYQAVFEKILGEKISTAPVIGS